MWFWKVEEEEGQVWGRVEEVWVGQACFLVTSVRLKSSIGLFNVEGLEDVLFA